MPSHRKLRRLLLTVSLALVLGLLQQKGYLQQFAQTAQEKQPGLYRVTSFTDGDTINVDMDGTTEKVRFIGVDTPETHDPRKTVQCFGQAAAAFTGDFIGANQVRLERDPQTTNRDRYNRLLRYVYLPNGQLVNGEIIKQGYGFAYVYFPFTKMEEFKGYQAAAEKQGAGLWGKCPTQTDSFGQSHTN
jgi:micrococcal nuclease